MASTLTGIYLFALIIGLFTAYLLNMMSPEMNPIFKFFIIPLIVVYLITYIGGSIINPVVKQTNDLVGYVNSNALNMINGLDYFYIYPPILFILVLLIIFLMSQK
jgi:hypothetical protein